PPQHGEVDPRRLFDAGLYDPRGKSLDARAWLGDEIRPNAHFHNRHDAEIKTYALMREAPIRAVALTLFLEALAEHCGADLLRLKAIVRVAEYPERPAVLHGVQHVFHSPTWLERWPSDDRRSRIVLITRRIPRGWVEALLDAIEAEVEEVESNSAGRPGTREARIRDPSTPTTEFGMIRGHGSPRSR